jgi:hypothetical protein
MNVNNKNLIILILMICVPFIAGCYLFSVVAEIENKYIGSINPKEIIEKIDKSDDLDTIKTVAKHYFLSDDEARINSISYFKSFYQLMFLFSFINLCLSILFIDINRKRLGSSAIEKANDEE